MLKADGKTVKEARHAAHPVASLLSLLRRANGVGCSGRCAPSGARDTERMIRLPRALADCCALSGQRRCCCCCPSAACASRCCSSSSCLAATASAAPATGAAGTSPAAGMPPLPPAPGGPKERLLRCDGRGRVRDVGCRPSGGVLGARCSSSTSSVADGRASGSRDRQRAMMSATSCGHSCGTLCIAGGCRGWG